jgi:hypothetical protein
MPVLPERARSRAARRAGLQSSVGTTDAVIGGCDRTLKDDPAGWSTDQVPEGEAFDAVALGVLALYLTLLGRGSPPSLSAAAFVVLILFVSYDLDRPQRGLITVPFKVLVDARAAMDLPPAATPIAVR